LLCYRQEFEKSKVSTLHQFDLRKTNLLKNLRVFTGIRLTALEHFGHGLRTFVSDVMQGFLAITHNGLALVGLVVFSATLVLTLKPDFRTQGETMLLGWLQQQQEETTGISTDADAVDRATATDPSELPKQQANLAFWLSRKYHVAPEPLSALVSEAYDVGPKNQLDPTLILAVMAIESGFNPFAQSPMGAQGLMQVMTKVHSENYDGFGGKLAAFDPVANLRVGVNVLKDCINRAGSVEGGLKLYVGGEQLEDGRLYALKVLSERSRLIQVVKGEKVPTGPETPIQKATDRLETLWEKAQRMVKFGDSSEETSNLKQNAE
jgi:hypothetical protein